jgi:hypothetical protein
MSYIIDHRYRPQPWVNPWQEPTVFPPEIVPWPNTPQPAPPSPPNVTITTTGAWDPCDIHRSIIRRQRDRIANLETLLTTIYEALEGVPSQAETVQTVLELIEAEM